MGRHGTRRGAHRNEPEDAGALRRIGGLVESTVPKRVEPPRLLNVLVVSGVILGLLLFGYSTTQIYLQFGGPGATNAPDPDAIAPSQDATADSGRDEAGFNGDGQGQGPQTQSGSSPITVGYEITETTDSGFVGLVTVTNTSESRLTAWELALAFETAEVTNVRDADWEPIEDGILARQPGDQDGLEPGESVTMGFDALGPAQSPVRCSLNGHVCGL
ncbi:cellulose binding domain-containing protein [Nocardiopsis sp. NRRL B-16309]|uniref:cellulose binding domain-containing protein n=1 Tax=Nocardiopsis sp. NRRL B-16309 TaxID=1519494 RepID=UPI0006B03A07|nr:cellulose binding domain-containing protein [Nocardiopsis sp. NRRL B-16309]KOX18234.1 cellulose-binding protein [Nocardiopsis sp. NRRL B-16309]